MNQSFKWKKLDFIECGENYSINLETAEIRNDKIGKILKPWLTGGYYRICLYMNRKRKMYYVHVLIWISHNGLYDTTKYDIDLFDHNRTNNNINNLRLASKSLNLINRSHMKGKSFDYQSELPDAYIVNAEHGIYYCKQFDKFYRKVSEHQYRELREYNQKNCKGTFIRWSLNNKLYNFTTSNFRDLI